jgi:RNA polymerase sigma factor (sigma-70 family)
MADTQLSTVVRGIRGLVTASDMKDRSDGQLLHDFQVAGDERAFACLVDRHGAMVLRVCRQVLQHQQDAEDAFQATFLVLARKAASLRESRVVASWLHRVAYRVALQARRNAGRRQAREARTPARPSASPAAEVAWREVQLILNEEIERLSEKYRAPFVLCCLEGHSRSEVARQLDLKEGTVWSRLSYARRQLQQRLRRRGIELGTVLAATSLAEGGMASTAPASLVAATLRTVTTGGKALSGVSGDVAALVHATLKTTTAARLSVALALLFVTAVLGAGWSVSVGQAPPGQPAEPGHPTQGKRIKEKGKARQHAVPFSFFLFPFSLDGHGDPLPEGAVVRLGTIRFNHGADLNHLLFTPDGKTILSGGRRLVRLWNAATGAETGQLPPPVAYVSGTTVTLPDSTTLVSLNEEGTGDFVRWWDLSKRQEIRTLKLPIRRSVFSAYHCNALSPGGTLAAIHVHTPAELRVFDLKDGSEVYRFPDGGKDVRAVALAGKDRLVTANIKAVIEVRDARTGKLSHRFQHGTPVDFLAVSADGRRLATFERHSEDRRDRHRDVIYLWDLPTGRKEQALRLPGGSGYQSALFSPDGKLLMTSSYGNDEYMLTVWDTATGRKVRDLPGAGACLAFSPDGKRLAAGGWSGKFDVWEVDTGRRFSSDDTLHAHANAACLSAAGDRVVTIGASISTWDSATGKRLHSLAVPADPYWDRSNCTPDGRFVLTFVRDGEAYQAAVWNVADGRKHFALPAPRQRIPGTTAFSTDGSLLATAHPGKPTLVRVWDLHQRKEVRSFTHPNPVRLFFSSDRKTLLIAGPKIAAFDLTGGKELFCWRMEPLKSATQVTTVTVVDGKAEGFDEDSRIAWRALAVSPDGSTLAAIHWTWAPVGKQSGEDRIALYDLTSGKLLRHWNDSGRQANMLEALTFSADGRLLASSDGHAIHVWEAASGAKVRSFHGHRAELTSLGFDRRGRRLVSAGFDSTVLVWDLTARLRDGKLPRRELSAANLEARWRDLADRDAARAYRAVWELAAAEDLTVHFLKQRLGAVPRPDPRQIARLISDLSSERFPVRQAAEAELKKLDVLAERALRQALRSDPPLELRRRLEQLLRGINDPVPPAETLRGLRALAVLEQIASPQAHELVGTLARGAPAAHVTREARATLGRLLQDANSR